MKIKKSHFVTDRQTDGHTMRLLGLLSEPIISPFSGHGDHGDVTWPQMVMAGYSRLWIGKAVVDTVVRMGLSSQLL